MYDKTKQCLKINGVNTETFPSYKGVRQGCVLSPLLFNIFINDLPDIFDKTCCPVKIGTQRISCLMYADDLIILSESKEGLKQGLKKLEIYAKKWRLTVNKKKSKILTFQKGGPIKKLKLQFNGSELEEVKEYKYLGTIVSNSGNFRQNELYLKNKGLRASFSLLKNIGLNMKPSSFLKLFERVIQPILLYNSEVTQAFIPVTWNYQKFERKIWDQGKEINKVLTNFLRQILGTHKKTTNFGVMSEVGKYPLIIRAYIHIIKYWVRLLTTENKLLQEIHLCELQTRNKVSWFSIVENLLKYTDMIDEVDIEKITAKPNVFINKFQDRIYTKYKQFWTKNMSEMEGKKLDFYSNYKKVFKFEKYLDMLNKEKREIISRFRLSAHSFPIEKLRYKNIKREERICTICNLNEIGDEKHYLFKCDNKNIKRCRTEFKIKVQTINPQLEYFDLDNSITYCITMNDELMHGETATFLENIITIYENEKYLNEN